MEWIYSSIGLMVIIVLAISWLSGCAVVKTDYSDQSKKNATVYYYLPESLIKIKASIKVAVVYDANNNNKLSQLTRVIDQGFETSTEMIADTKNLLSLNYKPNVLMADDIKYAVNAKGLLETVNITTEDRTTAIISKLAEAPATVLGITNKTLNGANTIVRFKEYSSDFVVKVSSLSNTPFVVNWNLIIVNELGQDDYLNVSADFKITLSNATTSPPSLSQLVNGNTGSNKTETEGIFTRPLKNIQLKIEPVSAGLNNTLPINIMVADCSKLIVIPVNRTAFVKRVNKIGIQDGIILSNEINKPSSVEGFLSIPIDIAKAVVSIPAQLIQFKFDNTKRLDELEKAKLNYEKSIQESQKFALTKEQEIEKVKLDMQKAELSNQVELQKLKLELQKSLLEAEAKQLEAQKALDAIKKQLEELKKGK